MIYYSEAYLLNEFWMKCHVKRLKEANDKLDKARHSNLNLTETELMHIIKFQFYLDKLVKKKR